MYGQFWSYICNRIFILKTFAGKTLIFRKPTLNKWSSSIFDFFTKENEIRWDYSTSIALNLTPFFRWVLQKSSQVAFKIYPPKVLINKMTALKNYTYVKIKQYEPAKSSMNKNLSCEWKKMLDHWSCFCSQVQFSIWYCILKQLPKWLNFERTQYCLISNTSVFLENSCRPDPPGGALFYGNSTKFLFFNPAGFPVFHTACKKFSIWSKNQIFGFEPEIFFGIK